MRAAVATAIAVVLAGLAGGAQAREASIYRGKCGEVVLPTGPTGIASAIRIRTACGAFVVDRRGVRYVGPDRVGRKWEELDGPNRAVGPLGERPLGWTRAGLLVTSQEQVLRARTRSGRLVRVLERKAGSRAFEPGSRTIVYVSRRGSLIRSDGRRAQTLVAGGLRRWTDLRPLEERRLAYVDRRLVVLRPDGTLLASDRRSFNLPVITSNGAIAIVATGPLDDQSRSIESVRLLRPGQRSSTVILTAKVGALGCGHWPTLAWRGDELLYSTNAGRVVVMEPGSGEHLDLTAVVKRLPGGFLEARWA